MTTFRPPYMIEATGRYSIPATRDQADEVLSTVSAVVSTLETTTSNTYTDLTTPGPAVTLNTGASGKALVILSAVLYNDTNAGEAFMGFSVDGAAVNEQRRLYTFVGTATNILHASSAYLVENLIAGPHTFTCKYRRNATGTANFQDRSIIVQAL